jgi:ribosomal protein L11 methyltransferase
MSSTSVVRITAEQASAERLALLAEERLSLDDLSIVVSEIAPDDALWRVDIFAGPNVAPADLEADVRRGMGEAIAGLDVVSEEIEDADWVAQSLAGLDPVEAGRFLVHGAHDRDRVPDTVIGIQVEAALAFGTGHHGTTRGCLLAFDQLLKERRPRRVLDLGTGTGVLAIAAAKALSQEILASDIDPISVRIARENAALNHVAAQVHVVEADGIADPVIAGGAPYDLVFANILAGPLVEMAPDIARIVAPGGVVILSGLLDHQEGMVRDAYQKQGLIVLDRFPLDTWMTLTLTSA